MAPRRAGVFAATLLCALAMRGAQATEWDASLDMRLVAADVYISAGDLGH